MATKKTTTKTTDTTAVKTSSVIQFQNIEFSEADCVKKVELAFKADNNGVELESLKIYIKPEERKIYYVANDDHTGSVDL